MYHLQDYVTKKRVTAKNFVFTGESSPWEVVMDPDQMRSKINPDYFRKLPPYVSKYLPLMPVRDVPNFVSLGEGATPLIRSRRLEKRFGAELYFKLESQNPTGAFKDRGSAVELTIARELGAPGISVASTGNMAASCSCYAAAANIPCFVFVPETTPASKLAQVIAYGGRIVQIKGGYNDAVSVAKQVAEQLNFYLAGDYAFRIEGQKTAAFELVDQLYFQAPDLVIIPIGCGTNVAAYGKGFREYRELGYIDSTPKIVGVQATGASSVVNSFNAGKHDVEKLERISTIASAIAVADPLDGVKSLAEIYTSGGSALAVSDSEILEAQYELSKEEGLFVESSGATTLAALSKLAASGSLAGKRIVCVLTGGGLKDPSTVLRVAIKPPTLYPSVGAFLELYNNAFFEGRSVAFVDREQVIFSATPTLVEIKQTLQSHLNARYSDDYLERIRKVIEKFLQKGKPVTFADLQDVVQDALDATPSHGNSSFSVVHFEVRTAKNSQAEALVRVLLDNSELEGRSKGVGPVDAVINALKDACGERIAFSLSGYKVHIRSQGTNAVVYVELTLTQGNTVSVGGGASPDIIQASIEAFEEAYRGFL